MLGHLKGTHGFFNQLGRLDEKDPSNMGLGWTKKGWGSPLTICGRWQMPLVPISKRAEAFKMAVGFA